MIDADVVQDKEYSKKEIDEIFDTKFGYSIKGITLRRGHDDSPYIIIFSRSRGPYSDKYIGDFLYYDGEGLKQDQKFKRRNKAIIESNETGRIIFGFR